MVKIEIGGGENPLSGFLNCDIRNLPTVDKVIDFNQKLPFEDNYVTEVYSSHCLEHVENVVDLIRDIVRICKVGSKVTFIVPHFGQDMAMSPGHVHIISEQMIGHMNEFEKFWWSSCDKKLTLRHTEYTPSKWFNRAKQLFPRFSNEEIFRYIQNTCHEIKFTFTVTNK